MEHKEDKKTKHPISLGMGLVMVWLVYSLLTSASNIYKSSLAIEAIWGYAVWGIVIETASILAVALIFVGIFKRLNIVWKFIMFWFSFLIVERIIEFFYTWTHRDDLVSYVSSIEPAIENFDMGFFMAIVIILTLVISIAVNAFLLWFFYKKKEFFNH